MEYHHILAFLTLSEELHFGRAADRLFIAQPTLSRNIRNLEHELGARLFERASRQVSLTEAGAAFLEPARALRASHQRALNSIAESARGLTGTVRLVFTGPSSYRFVGELTSQVSETYPGIQLELIGGGFAGEGLHRLLNNTADAALGRWSRTPQTISSTPLSKEDFVLAVPSNHPLAHRRSIAFSEAATEPFIRLAERLPSIITERLRELSDRLGVDLSTQLTAPDTWTALALVGSGLGVTLTLTSVRDNTSTAGVSFVDLQDDIEPTWLSLAWNTRFENPALHSVLRIAENVAKRAGRPEDGPKGA